MEHWGVRVFERRTADAGYWMLAEAKRLEKALNRVLRVVLGNTDFRMPDEGETSTPPTSPVRLRSGQALTKGRKKPPGSRIRSGMTSKVPILYSLSLTKSMLQLSSVSFF